MTTGVTVSSHGSRVHEYAVAAENGNGVRAESTAVDTDPRSWRHWNPPIDLVFRRQHTYNQPPYVPASMTPSIPQNYDHQQPPPRLPAIADEHPDGRLPR